MTPNQVDAALRKADVRFTADQAESHNKIIAQFYNDMAIRQYGVQETADAFMWFRDGWMAAKAQL